MRKVVEKIDAGLTALGVIRRELADKCPRYFRIPRSVPLEFQCVADALADLAGSDLCGAEVGYPNFMASTLESGRKPRRCDVAVRRYIDHRSRLAQDGHRAAGSWKVRSVLLNWVRTGPIGFVPVGQQGTRIRRGCSVARMASIEHDVDGDLVVCLNCTATVNGAFCSACGQARSTRRLRLSEVLHGAISQLWSLDSAVLRTLAGLTTGPGTLSRRFVEGRRVRYLQPVRYYLVAIAVTVLVNVFFGLEVPDFGVTGASARQIEIREIVQAFVLTKLDFVLMAVVLPFVLVVYGLYRRSGLNLAEVSVFVFYVLGHVALLGLLLSPFRGAFPGLVMGLKLGLHLAWMTWGAKRFFEVSWGEAAIKSFVGLILYVALVTCVVFVAVLPRIQLLLRGHPTG